MSTATPMMDAVEGMDQTEAAARLELASVPGLFLYREGNRRFLQGKSSLYMGSLSTLASGIVIAALALWLLSIALAHLSRSLPFALDGAELPATVVEKRPFGTQFFLFYTFTPPGAAEVAGEQTISGALYEQVEVEQPVIVTYRRSDPSQSLLSTRLGERLIEAVVWLASGLGVGGLAVWILGRHLLQRDRLNRYGKALRGTVTACRATQAEDSKFEVLLTYTFRSPDQTKTFTANAFRVMNRERYLHAAPRQGMPVAVLYVDETLYLLL